VAKVITMRVPSDTAQFAAPPQRENEEFWDNLRV
jgi:hypothetical protein